MKINLVIKFIITIFVLELENKRDMKERTFMFEFTEAQLASLKRALRESGLDLPANFNLYNYFCEAIKTDFDVEYLKNCQ